jgi:ribosomal protein S21
VGNPIQDMPAVVVHDGKMEKAIRELHRRVVSSGHLKANRRRELFPNQGERKRDRRRRAEFRRLRDGGR